MTAVRRTPRRRFSFPAGWPQVSDVDAQPLVASIKRLTSALELAGSPLDAATIRSLEQAYAASNAEAAKLIQQALDPLCIAAVSVNPESRVKVAALASRQELMQNGWRTFLVKVHNEAGVTAGTSRQQSTSTDVLAAQLWLCRTKTKHFSG